MKKRKQILMSSLAMLVVASIALTSTTYAWFTSSTEGKVDDFEFTAEDASGIQLSVDADNWKSTITSDDIKTAVTTLTATPSSAQAGSLFTEQVTTFKPLSTHPDTATSDTYTPKGRLTLFKTEADDDKLKAIALTDEKYYYVFNIYVNNLSSNSKQLTLADFNVFGVNLADKNTQYASRIAFIDEGSIAKASGTAAEVKAAVVATNEAVSTKILEPNANSHTGFAKTYYSISNLTDPLAYYGIKAEGSFAVDNGFVVAKAGSVEEVTTFTNKTTSVATLDGDSITKLTVYVWIEGQDIDCNNDIASGKVCVNLSFTSSETAAQYKVTYKADSQATNLPTDATNYAAKADVTVKFTDGTSAPKWTGHTFLGWSSKNGATTPDFKVGGTTSFKIVDNVTLYAVWAGPQTLTYDLNGGSVVGTTWTQPGVHNGYFGEIVPISFPTTAELTKTGKIFKGWSTTQNGAVEYAAGNVTNITLDGDKTLYAVWADTATITFANNTTDTVSDMPTQVVCEVGTTYTLPTLSPAPHRTDATKAYVFKGWTTVANGTVVQYAANGSAAFTVNANITLYAVWEEYGYVVTFNKGTTDEVTNMPAAVEVATGTSYTIPTLTQEPQRTGYVFMGWSATYENATAEYPANGTTSVTEAKTLYAIWGN